MWPDQAEIDGLLERYRGGDAMAAGELLALHRSAVRRMIELRLDPMVRRRVDASDVVQDVLVEAHARMPEYAARPVLEFGLWLRQIARDRMIDAYRRHRLAARRSIDREQAIAPALADQSALDLAGLLADREATPAAQAVAHELERRFAAALEQLDEPDREIIVLRHHEQLGNQEAAQVLGLSEPAAGMRYLRAMRRLRALLGERPSSQGWT